MLTARQAPSSGPLDWERLEIPLELKDAARSIEFTCCALVSRTAGKPVHNLFTSAVVRSRPPAQGWRHRTPKLVEITDGGLSFGILEGDVPGDQGIAALGFADELVLPAYQDGRVRAPGEWTVPRFWGRGDVSRPAWLPCVHEPFWTVERFAPRWPEGLMLPESALTRIARALRDHLGIDVPRERWGGLVVVVPDPRVWTVAEAAQGPRLGVEIRPRSGPVPKLFFVTTRTRRLGAIEFSRTHLLGCGRHALPFPELFDEMEVEITDASSGYPLDRHVGPIFRELNFSMDMSAGEPAVAVADFVDPPREVQLNFVDRQRSVLGVRATWENSLADESRRRGVEALRRSGHVAFYLGGLGADREADRRRAIADVQRIIHAAHTRVWIWDKYFGSEEVLDFLTAVADVRTDVRVMTSVEIDRSDRIAPLTVETDETHTTAMKGPDSLSRLRRAVAWMRAPPGLPRGGLGALDVRLGPRLPSHDRFLITDERCVILGCSLNQLGNVCSTTLEFPDREAVETAFLNAWQAASPIGG